MNPYRKLADRADGSSHGEDGADLALFALIALVLATVLGFIFAIILVVNVLGVPVGPIVVGVSLLYGLWRLVSRALRDADDIEPDPFAKDTHGREDAR